MRRKLSYYNRFLALFVVILGMTVFQSCENNPNTLGLEFILSDTLNTKLLDSNKDSLLITSNNYKKLLNTYYSGYFMVGKYQGYESKALLRTVGVSGLYAGATVLSAKLKFNYAKYAYQDTTGSVSFNVYPLNKYFNYSSITYDSLNSGNIGVNQLGTYTGSPADTSSIYIPFDVTVAKNWLEYAADTNYAAKNYGIAFLSNASSNTIKAFGGYLQAGTAPNLSPKIVIVANKNNKTDTLVYDFETLTLTNVNNLTYIPDRFQVQNGISFYNILNFNISKVPANSIINEAYLRLKLDKPVSYIQAGASLDMYYYMMLDTIAKTNDAVSIKSLLEDSVTVSVRLTPFFQKWNYGMMTNFGVTMKNTNDLFNLDRFVFFGPSVQDTSKRPKLVIRYTPRG
ncbi:MAG: DNRLRE domain-containing protein [Ignavibacteriota bacterium]|nr:DNRLRE domain-containing protein [Ignavibacteriota bacterium]